jgi:hypothetical protein
VWIVVFLVGLIGFACTVAGFWEIPE